MPDPTKVATKAADKVFSAPPQPRNDKKKVAPVAALLHIKKNPPLARETGCLTGAHRAASTGARKFK